MNKTHTFFKVINLRDFLANFIYLGGNKAPNSLLGEAPHVTHIKWESSSKRGKKQFSFQGNRYSISLHILCTLHTASSCSSDAWNLEESDDLTSFSPRAFALLSIRASHWGLTAESPWRNESPAQIRYAGSAVKIKPALTTSSFTSVSTDINITAWRQASCSQQGLPTTKRHRLISSSLML